MTEPQAAEKQSEPKAIKVEIKVSPVGSCEAKVDTTVVLSGKTLPPTLVAVAKAVTDKANSAKEFTLGY